MTERERLIELLRNQNCHSPMLCDENCKYAHLERCYEDRTADWLLANGVIVPPCKVGDKIYRCDFVSHKVIDWDIVRIDVYEDEMVYLDDSYNVITDDDFGKTVFLSREDAEKALKERSEGK